ncbi:phosphopantetheine-binding protein [Actinophytocola sp. KF-1]
MTSDRLRAISQKVEQIWREVLDVAEGQEDATFFELEGQSISAVRIAARVEDEIGVQVDIGDLFEDPDLATFVRDVVAKVDIARYDERRSA